MQIIDHDPHYWFLVREGNEEYLSVRCQASFAEYSMLIRLSPDERAAHQAGRHAYADTLAMDINDHRDSYQERDYEKELGDRVTQTVVAWRTGTSSH